jgi:hypothetical protein
MQYTRVKTERERERERETVLPGGEELEELSESKGEESGEEREVGGNDGRIGRRRSEPR